MIQPAKTRIRERAQAAGQSELPIDAPTDPVLPRNAKTPPDVAEYQDDGSALVDGQVFESRQWFGRGETRRERRVVYQYREKRARLDLRNIEKQVEKAKKVVTGTIPVEKGRFLKISGTTKSIDEPLVEPARQRAVD